MNAIELTDVSKTFRNQKAVDQLTLEIPQGSIYGFIGPNGSGKTTTLRMILRIYYPDSGSGPIRVFGNDHSAVTNDLIGYLPEERGLYRKMKVRDLLKFFLELRGSRDFSRIDTWLNRMHLKDRADSKVETLSKGLSQRVQFISAVIHNPRLLILDEPFSGLDPVSTDELREAILALRENGTTIIFSTHDMSMAEQMCDALLMIYKGRKVLDGTLDHIKEEYGTDTIRVRIEGSRLEEGSIPHVEKIVDFGRLQELKIQPDADSQAILQHLASRGRVHHFEIMQPTLHDIFVRIARPEPEDLTHA